MEIKTETKVIEYIEYDGLKFYHDKRGYWVSPRSIVTGCPQRLHTYVWEKYNGKVPEGCHIHHIDHNTANNEIDNLMLMDAHEHLCYHAALQNKTKAAETLAKYAQPAARLWHKSDAGREWHKQHYDSTKDNLYQTVTIECIVCGKTVTRGRGGGGNKFCSDACKSRYRAKQKTDYITANCEYCGKEFQKNKYQPTKYCCRSCSARGSAPKANESRARKRQGELSCA